MAEINSIFDYIFPRKKASDYQQTNLLDYGESPESQNVYNPGQGDFGVMSLEGLKNSIPSTVSGTLDFMYDSAGTLRRPDFKQVQDNVEPEDFNIYNAYAGTDKFQPFTTSFRQTGLLPTKEEEEAFRQRSMGYDLGKYGGQFLLGGMGVRSATGKSLGEAMNFAIPGLTLDLEDPNIGDALDALGMDNEFQQFLQGNIDENSTAGERLKQRFTNMLGEFGINVVADTAINTLKVAKNLYKDPEYREQALKNIGRDMYGDLPGSQIFAGETAKGADKDMLAIAKARYKSENLNDFNSPRAFQGREQVWSETGWAQDRNGKWYFEIDDSELEIPDYVLNNIKSDKSYAIGLGGGIKHDKLFKQYPELEDYTINFVPGERIADSNQIAIKGSTAQAGADFKNKTIHIPKLDDGTLAPDVKESIAHELQHMVQEKERFMNGGDGSLGFAMTLRDQLTKEAIDKAQDPGLFKTMMNFRRLVDYNQQQPVFAEILNLLKRDKVDEALTKLKGTSWWASEGDMFTYKLQQKLKKKGIDKDYYKNNPNALKTELLGGTVDLEKIVKTYNDDINKIYQSFQNTYKTNDPVGDVRNFIQDTLEKVGGNVALLKKVLSDRAGKAFGGDNDYFLNKLRMIDDVENGVYKDAVARKQVYNQLTGESQSRNVERRINMNEEQRRMNFPEYSEEFGRVTKEGQFGKVTSDMSPIYVDRPGQFTKRKWEESQGVLQLADEQPMPKGFRFKTEGEPTDYIESDKVMGIAKNQEKTGLMGEKYVDYDLVDKEGRQFYPEQDMTFGKVRIFYNSEGKIESINPPEINSSYMYNEQRRDEAMSEFFEGLKGTENTNQQIVIRGIKPQEIEKYRALGVKYDGFGDPYDEPIASGKIRPGEMDIEAFKNYKPTTTDEAGFFLRSEKILNETNKDTWKNPDEVFMEGKKGKSGLLKDVPKQELEETGLLDYLAKAKAEGKPVTKKGLLDQLDTGRPTLTKSEAYYVYEDMSSGLDAYDIDFDDARANTLDFEESYSQYRGEDYAKDIVYDVTEFIDRFRDEYNALADTPIGVEFELLLPKLPKLAKDGYQNLPADVSRIIDEYAEDIARLDYEKNPEYYMYLQGDFEGAPRILVSGNDELGYSAYDESAGQSIISEEYNLNEVNVKIDEYLQEEYYDYMFGQGVNETFWKDYASPGYFDESTYKEINAEVIQNDLEYPTAVNQHSLPGNEDESLFFTRTTERDVNTPEDGYVTALHIDEIQSDWHQQLRKFGIDPEEATRKGRNAENALQEMRVKVSELVQKQADQYENLREVELTFLDDIINQDPFLKKNKDLIDNAMIADFGRADTTVRTFIKEIKPVIEGKSLYKPYVDAETTIDVMKALNKKVSKMHEKVISPYKAVIKEKEKADAVVRKLEKFIVDAPGRQGLDDYKNYTGVGGSKPPLANEKWEETALKMNIMDAIDRNIDYVVWTPSDVQIAQWGEDSAELYKNIYDKRLPKNAKKFINEFGGELQKGKVDYGTRGTRKELGFKEVWVIKITPEMKKNLTKQGGMPLYQYGVPVPFGLLGMENQDNGRIDENKGLLQ